MPDDKLTIEQFAARIKAKYPEYKDVNDTLLTQKIVDKYPEYKDMVNYQISPTSPTITERPEHEISHTSIQDARHFNEMANRDIPAEEQMVTNPDSGIPEVNPAIQQDKDKYTNLYEQSLKDLGSKLGVDPNNLKAVVSDFPEENDETRIQQKATLKNENPETYERLKTADENMHLLYKSGGQKVAHEYNELQGTEEQPIQNLAHLKQSIDEQREIILSNLSGSDRDKALANLEHNRSSFFNASNPEIQNEFANNEPAKATMNVMQFAGLKHLQAFDPQKAELYANILKPRDDEADDTTEMKIGKEKALKDLLTIGRSNTEHYINEKQYELDKAYKNAQTPEEKDQIAQQFLKNKGIVDAMTQDEQTDATKFPYLKDLEFERQARELSGESAKGVVNYALSKFGRSIGKSAGAIPILMVNALGEDQDINELNMSLLGAAEKEKNEFYLKESDKPEGSAMIYKFDKGLQDAATEIKNDKSLSDEQKEGKLIDLVKDNQDQVHTISNTEKFGKSANFFSKATLYKNAGMIGDIASVAAQAAGGNEVALGKFLSNTLPMYLSTQNDFYTQALEEGRANPMAYANTHAAIMMAAGAISPNLNIVKKALGANTELGKAIAGVSEEAWNDVVSKNKSLLNKIKASALSVGKETAKIGLTYGAGTSIAKDLADKGLFGKNLSGEDIVNNAVKATKDATISSVALLGLHAITNFKTASPEDKARIWELGDNPKLANEQLDESAKKGEITTAIADQRKQVIKTVSKLIDSVPVEDAKGKPLTDQQRADYLYNLVLKNKIDAIKGDLPDAQKEKLEAIKRGVDIENNSILDPKSEKENLMQRKRELTDELKPSEDGSSNLTPLEKKTRQAELDEINIKLDDLSKPKIEVEKPTEGAGNEPQGAASSISVIRPGELSKPEAVTIKPQENAIQEPQTGEILQRQSEETGESRSGRERMEPVQQGTEAAREVGSEKENFNSSPISQKGKDAIAEAIARKKEVEDAGFNFLTQEDDGGFYNKNRQYAPNEVPIGMVGLKYEEQGKGLGTLGYILKGEEYLKQGKHLVSDVPHIPEARTEQAEGVWKKLVNLGLATETSPGNYRYGGEREPIPNKNQSIDPVGRQEEDWPFVEEPGDNEVTSIKNKVTEQKIQENGLTPALKAAKRALADVWDEAVSKINKGKISPEKLLSDLKRKPRPITDTEDAVLLYHQATKEAELDQINKDINEVYDKGTRAEFDELQYRKAKVLDDLQDIYDVDKKVGTANARGLNARKMMLDRRFSLVNMMAEQRAANEGKPLTTEEQAEVEKKYNELKNTNAAIEKRVAELEAENTALKNKATSEPEEVKPTVPKKSKKQYADERKEIIKDMRADLLKAAKGAGGLTSSIPLAAQLKAVAPHIPKLVKNLVQDGVRTLDEATTAIMDMLKPDIDGLTKQHVHDLIAGEFDEAKKKYPSSSWKPFKKQAESTKLAITDPELMKLRANYERKKAAWGDGLRRAELAKRTRFEKLQDGWVKWQRAWKLSGITTLAKLSMAGATRLASSPIEEAVGGAYSAVLPKGITSKATGEAGLNVKAEAKALTIGLMKGFKDSYDIMSKERRGQSDIDALFGKHELPPEAIGFFGQLHSAIKAPIKRAAFERSMNKRIVANIKNGVDVSDPMVQTKIAIQSYKDSQRAIFMQDNFLTDAYKRSINALEQTKNSKGESHPGAKLLATTLQWLIPFVKVPTNIIGETQRHVTGLGEGAVRLGYQAMKNGLKDVTEEEADAIMRAFKKGTLGAGALMIGYFNADKFGGFYQKGTKQPEDKLKPGSAKILGLKVPVWLLEAPLFQAMQLGATVRKLHDAKMTKTPQNLLVSMGMAELDLGGHNPLVEQPGRISELFKSPHDRKYFLGELAKGTIVPAGVSNIAQFTDSENSRKPESVMEHIETGIPGLRETVPTKPKKGDKVEHHRNTGGKK